MGTFLPKQRGHHDPSFLPDPSTWQSVASQTLCSASLHFHRHLSCLRLGPDRHRPPLCLARLSANVLFSAKRFFRLLAQPASLQDRHHDPFFPPEPAIWNSFAGQGLCVGFLHFHNHWSLFRCGPDRHFPPRCFASLSASFLFALNMVCRWPAHTSRPILNFLFM